MIEVDIENFQSIEKVSIQIDGFTVLVGRSNIGKSAIARAIKYALTGALGTNFVRHGARCERRLRKAKSCRCFTKVSVRTSGVHLVWQKGDEVNSYTITRDGVTQEYSALDRGDPEFLKPEFQQIQIGDSRHLIQVTDQFDPIFLLNKSGGVVADVLSDVANLDEINEAIRLVNKDRKDASATRTVRERDVVELRQTYQEFDGLDETLKKAEEVEALFLKAESIRQGLGTLTKFLETLSSLKVAFELLRGALGPALPDWDGVEAKASSLFEAQRLLDAFQDRTAAVAQLTAVETLLVPEVSNTQAVLDRLAPLEGWLARLRVIKSGLLLCQGVTSVKEPNMPAEARPKIDALAKLQELLSRQTQLQTRVDELTGGLEKATQEETTVLAEFEVLGVCPTCTQGISAPSHLHGDT